MADIITEIDNLKSFLDNKSELKNIEFQLWTGNYNLDDISMDEYDNFDSKIQNLEVLCILNTNDYDFIIMIDNCNKHLLSHILKYKYPDKKLLVSYKLTHITNYLIYLIHSIKYAKFYDIDLENLYKNIESILKNKQIAFKTYNLNNQQIHIPYFV